MVTFKERKTNGEGAKPNWEKSRCTIAAAVVIATVAQLKAGEKQSL